MSSVYLTQALHRALRQYPERVATIYGSRRRTYGELARRVARLAAGLRSLGMSNGDRVGILTLNSDRYQELCLAIWWGGGVANPINSRWSPREIIHALDDCDTRILAVDESFAPLVEDLTQGSRSLRTIIYSGDAQARPGMFDHEQLIADHKPVEDVRRSNSELAGVYYTGGTTGVPKGVMLSHLNLFSNALIGIAEGFVQEGDVGLHSAPLFHLAGGLFALMLLEHGCTQVVLPAFAAEPVMQAIQDERVTNALLVPTMLQMVVDHPKLPQYGLETLQRVMYGASPISEALLRRAFERLPEVEFRQAYGQTEMSPLVSVLQPEFHQVGVGTTNRLRSAGRAALGVEIRIADPGDVEVPRGCVGEVTARGPGVMLGYWNDLMQTATSLRNGWIHTGDAGYMDEEGFLFIVDRVKDMIVSGAENVYPAEVENAIALHPSIATCAVIGIPDDRWGEAVHAVIVCKSGAPAPSVDELRVHCQALIASYKCPRSLDVKDSLPVSSTGKVLKTALREPYWGHQLRRVS